MAYFRRVVVVAVVVFKLALQVRPRTARSRPRGPGAAPRAVQAERILDLGLILPHRQQRII